MEDIKNFVPSSYNSYGNDEGDGYGYGGGIGIHSSYGDCLGRSGRIGYGGGYGISLGISGGCGYRDGKGYGSGKGKGIESYNGIQSVAIDGIYTFITKIHGNLAKGFVLNDDMTKKECYVVKYQGCFAHGSTAKEAEEAAIKKYKEKSK